MQDEESEGQSETVPFAEQEVGGPGKVGQLEEEPAQSGLDVDLRDRTRHASVVYFDAGEDQPAHDAVAQHDVHAC